MCELIEKHEPIADCDCRECACAERDRIRAALELEIARTWQPDYATKMDRDTIDLAAAEVGNIVTTQQITHLQKLGKRLAEMLDEDQWSECEALLLAAGVTPNAKA